MSVEEIVACWEAKPTDIVGLTKMRALIASWRERGDALAPLRERVAELQAETGYTDAIAIARERKLVAALEEARVYIVDTADWHDADVSEHVLTAIDAALAAAGHTQAHGRDDWIHEIIMRYRNDDIDVHSAMREIEDGLAPAAGHKQGSGK